jgi:hypothetical protein
MAQMDFFDHSDRYASLDSKRDPMAKINAIIPRDAFRPVLERGWRNPQRSAPAPVAQTGKTQTRSLAHAG